MESERRLALGHGEITVFFLTDEKRFCYSIYRFEDGSFFEK